MSASEQWKLIVKQEGRMVGSEKIEFPKSTDQIYPYNRSLSYERFLRDIHNSLEYKSDFISIVRGDSFDVLRRAPSNSVDLILTDPPYHSSKKNNIFGDTMFDTDDDYLSWMSGYFEEFHRILKPNGSLYLFCSSSMAPFLYVSLSNIFNMHNMLSWSKPNEPGYDGWKQKMNKKALRAWYPHSERIIFASPAYQGNLKRTLFGQFLKKCREVAKLSSKELTELVGEYGKINNGGAVSNWETGRNIPSKEQWEKIDAALKGTGRISLLPAYEDLIRPFNADPDANFIDVWDHKNVRQYKGKHPAEKPMDLLTQIISTSSYEGDVVLDCFMGSGSTLQAAQNLGRRAIGIEIEEKWVKYAASRFERSNVKNEIIPASRYSGLPLLQEA